MAAAAPPSSPPLVSGGFSSAIALHRHPASPVESLVAFSPTSIASPGSGTSTATFTVGFIRGGWHLQHHHYRYWRRHHSYRNRFAHRHRGHRGCFHRSPSHPPPAIWIGGRAAMRSSPCPFREASALPLLYLPVEYPQASPTALRPASIAAPGSGTSDFNLSVARNARTGTYPITITATGGGITHTTTLTFQINTLTR